MLYHQPGILKIVKNKRLQLAGRSQNPLIIVIEEKAAGETMSEP